MPPVRVNTAVQHTSTQLALTGALQPRRVVVSDEKCNVCHAVLGTASGSNTMANAFHSGARNTWQACVVCHDANRASSTVMTNGLQLNESYQFNRMIHGIHGNSMRVLSRSRTATRRSARSATRPTRARKRRRPATPR